jgi:hypothetical protein
MAALILVIGLTFSVRRRITAAKESQVNDATGRLVAVVSLTLWTTVALGGRYIGFP